MIISAADIMEAFQVYPWLLYLSAATLGLIVGSFLNVVIHRLPIMMEREWQQQLLASAMERIKARASPKQFRLFHALVVQGLAGAEVARMFDTNLAGRLRRSPSHCSPDQKGGTTIEAELSTRGVLG